MKQDMWRFIIRIMGWFGVFLLLASIALEALPLMHTNGLSTFHLAARQRVLEQRIVTDVLILAYRPADEHPEALSEMQAALPVWERVQRGLQIGDDSLGISPNLPTDVKLMLLQMQPDFTYMDTAAHQILAHHESIDADEVTIVIQHEQPYFLAMGQTVQLFQEDINNVAQIYFGIELALGLILTVIWIVFIISMNRRNRKEKHETIRAQADQTPDQEY